MNKLLKAENESAILSLPVSLLVDLICTLENNKEKKLPSIDSNVLAKCSGACGKCWQK